VTRTTKCPAGDSPAAWAVRTGRVAEGGPTHAMLKQLEGSGQRAFAAQFAEAVAVGARLGAPLPEATPTASGPSSGRSRSVPVGGNGDPVYARNPLVDEVRRTRPQASLPAASDAPTLFHSGDLPPFTASGIDPKILLNVPWQARHPVAAAPTTAHAYALLDQYTGPEAEIAAALNFGGHPGNVAYKARVRNWLVESMSEDEQYAAMFGSQEERKQAWDKARKRLT
jgi:hypothetical protein